MEALAVLWIGGIAFVAWAERRHVEMALLVVWIVMLGFALYPIGQLIVAWLAGLAR